MTVSAWFHGLAAAFIGGGASGVSASVAAIGIDPATFNLSGGLLNVAKLAGTVFVVSGALSAFGYLKQSPIPNGTT
jgi:hypothetical protein